MTPASSSHMHNLINVATMTTMVADWQLIEQAKTELADAQARAKGIVNYRGYQYLGIIFNCSKYQSVRTQPHEHAHIPLEPEFWDSGERIKKRIDTWQSERDRLKQWLALYLMNVSKDSVQHWVSALPSALTNEMFPVYNTITRIYDCDYWRPLEPTKAAQWDRMMEMIHGKLALRLLV